MRLRKARPIKEMPDQVRHDEREVGPCVGLVEHSRFFFASARSKEGSEFAQGKARPIKEMPDQVRHDGKTIKTIIDLLKDGQLYIAHSENGNINLVGKMANRHGLIAGATGTGKTVTLQVLAETFSQAGVPCFMADMKGDLSGISQAGKLSGFIEKRMPEFGIENPQFAGCPTRFFDVFGEQGFPMRATISA